MKRFSITKVHVVHDSQGTDRVYLHTDLPNNIVGGNNEVVLSFELRRGTAEAWLRENADCVPDSILSV